MLVGDDCLLSTLDGGDIKISTINGKLNNVIVDENVTTTLLSIKHHKKFKLMTKLIFEDNSYVIIGKHTYVQVVEEHDIGKLIEAMDVQPGQLLCPPLPSYADIRLWGDSFGIAVKAKQTILYRASTILFDECEYLTINGVPILHDNHQFRHIRRIVKRSDSVGNLLFKHTGLYKID
jgi:hypothetical protein